MLALLEHPYPKQPGKTIYNNPKLGLRFHVPTTCSIEESMQYPQNSPPIHIAYFQDQINLLENFCLMSTTANYGSDLDREILMLQSILSNECPGGKFSCSKRKIGTIESAIVEGEGLIQNIKSKIWNCIVLAHGCVYVWSHGWHVPQRYNPAVLENFCVSVQYFYPTEQGTIQFIGKNGLSLYCIPSLLFLPIEQQSPLFQLLLGTVSGNRISLLFPEFCKSIVELRVVWASVAQVKSSKLVKEEDFMMIDGEQVKLCTFRDNSKQTTEYVVFGCKSKIYYVLAFATNDQDPWTLELIMQCLSSLSTSAEIPKTNILRYNNYFRLNCSIDLPMEGEYGDYTCNPVFSFTSKSMDCHLAVHDRMEILPINLHLKHYQDSMVKQGVTCNAKLIKMVDVPGYGKFPVIQLLSTIENEAGKTIQFVTHVRHGDMLVSLQSFCPFPLYNKKMLEQMKDLHQTIRVGDFPFYETEFKIELRREKKFCDVDFKLSDFKMIKSDINVCGIQLTYSSNWIVKYGPTGTEQVITVTNDDLEGIINVGFATFIYTEESFAVYLKAVTDQILSGGVKDAKFSTVKLKGPANSIVNATIMKYSLIGHLWWTMHCFFETRSYMFSADGDSIGLLSDMFMKCQLFTGYSSGRVWITNSTHSFKTLIPSIDFDTIEPSNDSYIYEARLEDGAALEEKQEIDELFPEGGHALLTPKIKSLRNLKENRLSKWSGGMSVKHHNLVLKQGIENVCFSVDLGDRVCTEMSFMDKDAGITLLSTSLKTYLNPEHQHDVGILQETRFEKFDRNHLIYEGISHNIVIKLPCFTKMREMRFSDNLYASESIVQFLSPGDLDTVLTRSRNMTLDDGNIDNKVNSLLRHFIGSCRIVKTVVDRVNDILIIQFTFTDFFDGHGSTRSGVVSHLFFNSQTSFMLESLCPSDTFDDPEIQDAIKMIHSNVTRFMKFTIFEPDRDESSLRCDPYDVMHFFSDIVVVTQ